MKEYKMLIVVSLLIPIILYLMGSTHAANFNLAEWEKKARTVWVYIWIWSQIAVLLFLNKGL